MNFRHPPNKRYHLMSPDMSPMETVVLHLSPYTIGRLGGEMAKRMVDAAENYLEEITTKEIIRSFREGIVPSDEAKGAEAPSASAILSSLSPSAGEAPASQYPSGNGHH